MRRTYLDVTDRKEAEEENRRLRDELRQTLDTAAVGLVRNSRDLKYQWANPAYAQIAGLPVERVVGRPIPEVMGEKAFEIIRPQVERVLRGERVEYEAELPWSTAGPKVLHVVYTPWRDAGGDVTGWVASVTDVTARRRAEEALRASGERYRRLFTSMDEGFCVVEVLFEGDAAVDYRFLEVNPAFEKHTGLKDAGGRRMRELAPGHDPHWFEIYGRVARTGEPVRFVNEATALGRWFDVYAFPAGGENRVAILFTDITARVRDERERERLVEQLRDADRRKDDFLALLAHELRNPLAPLRNGLQVIRLSEERTARERSQAIMDRQLAHMVRLIDDLLDVSRISRDKMELRRSRVLLSDVVSSAIETVRPIVDAAGHELTVSLPAESLHLDADLTRLAQVFGNLLSNSAKYTPPGGRIRLAVEARDGHAVVTVTDNGIGIPAAFLPKIFDMFSQVDRSIERSTGGLGIGLALVKGLVEMHGGTVTAASDGPGCGSTFTVRLPLLATDFAPEPHAQNGVTAVGSGRRVLVVDDNRDSAESMAEMLKLIGYSVAVAHDGLQAVAVAERMRPDVVLMDVGMPQMNGLDATRRIREQPWGRDTVIVALTGWGQEEDRARSKEAGCDGHLVKPVNLPDLQGLLGQLT